MRGLRKHLAWVSVFVTAMALAPLAGAMEPGDLLVTDGWYGLFFVERTTGFVHHVGPPSVAVTEGLIGVACDPAGKVYAALPYAGVVYSIDPASGAYTPLASGGFLQYPRALSVLPGGDVLVADNAGVIRIDATSGAQARLWSGPAYASAVTPGGELYVVLLDPGRAVEPAGLLYRMDAATGDTTRASTTHVRTNGLLASESDGDLVLTQPAESAVKRILLPSGAMQLLASGGDLVQPFGVTVEDDGTIVVADAHLNGTCGAPGVTDCHGLLYRVDPVSGGTSLVVSQDLAWRLGGIAVYHGPSVVTPARATSWGRLKARR